MIMGKDEFDEPDEIALGDVNNEDIDISNEHNVKDALTTSADWEHLLRDDVIRENTGGAGSFKNDLTKNVLLDGQNDRDDLAPHELTEDDKNKGDSQPDTQ